MKRVISCVLLMLVLTSNAFALEVPTDTVVQNLNGSQQAIKTFTVSPEQDPAALIEEPFELEGYLYTFADIVKSENPVEEKRIHTEVITVETTKDDLALILEQLKPTIEYDDGRFQGTLALDHTSLNTVAAGYATKNYTVTETKTIGQLDRNDMSYVPATTIKNGRTLSLANVEWQVTGTDLVGEASISGCCYLLCESVLSGGYRLCYNSGVCWRCDPRGRRKRYLCTDLYRDRSEPQGRGCRSGRSVFCGSLSLDLRWNRSDLRRCWRHAACMPPKGRSESRM